MQEMMSVGKKPDNLRDLIPEGEIILTFNIMYPILFQRVCPACNFNIAVVYVSFSIDWMFILIVPV